VAGERRFRAAKIAGLDMVPVIVKKYSENERLQISLIENIQRENLNPIEEASAYDALIKQTGLRQEELAQQIGKNRSTIANSLRLLKLPRVYKDALIEGSITPGHGRAILSVSNPADREVLFSKIIDTGFSVREAEELAERLNKGSRGSKRDGPTKKKAKTPELREIEEQLIGSLGTKVQVKGSLNSGKIEITYYSQADLDRLYDLLSSE
jgi:ParB family chromosome partitioning protein